MKFYKFSFIYVFALSSFATASEPGQEDTPSLAPLHADKIWSHDAVGNHFLDINKAREQLEYARKALNDIQAIPGNAGMVPFHEEIVRIKQAQLDYLLTLGVAGDVPEVHKAAIVPPVSSKKAQRKSRKPIVVYTKKKQ